VLLRIRKAKDDDEKGGGGRMIYTPFPLDDKAELKCQVFLTKGTFAYLNSCYAHSVYSSTVKLHPSQVNSFQFTFVHALKDSISLV